jgi:hypothetical protein
MCLFIYLFIFLCRLHFIFLGAVLFFFDNTLSGRCCGFCRGFFYNRLSQLPNTATRLHGCHAPMPLVPATSCAAFKGTNAYKAISLSNVRTPINTRETHCTSRCSQGSDCSLQSRVSDPPFQSNGDQLPPDFQVSLPSLRRASALGPTCSRVCAIYSL